jgi:hypothetical protein
MNKQYLALVFYDSDKLREFSNKPTYPTSYLEQANSDKLHP